MELAVKKLENIVKVMTRKVINLEEELVSVKDSMNNPVLNKTKKGLGHQENVKEKVNDFKEDIHNEGFNPKVTSSPTDKDRVKKDEVKEHFLACSKCSYKSKKEALLKKHMLTKHEDHTCKECKEKFQSLMELLKHVSKHHFNEKDEVKEINDQGQELVQKKDNQKIINLEDSDEVKSIKRNKNKEKMRKKKKTKVLSSVSRSFSMNL